MPLLLRQNLSPMGKLIADTSWGKLLMSMEAINKSGCPMMSLHPTHALNGRTDLFLPREDLRDQWSLWTTSKHHGSNDYMLEEVRNPKIVFF
jgi:hypothetical protein